MAGTKRGAETLSRRTLNRALLERQLLLRRSSGSIEAALDHLVGLQAQEPFPPYFALWSRVRDFAPAELGQLILDRKVVRIVLMRSTIHMVKADDALWLRPLVQRIMDRHLLANAEVRGKIPEADLPKLAAAGRALLESRPRTMSEVGAALQERWPDRTATALGYAVRNLVPLVQVPPRAIWGHEGPTPATNTPIEAWVGRPLDAGARLETLVLRYLAAFGPASVMDIQAWCGLTRLHAVVEELRPRLRTFRTEDGRELWDLPDAPLPDPDTPAPVRFLSLLDNAILSHADRTRIISHANRKRSFPKNGRVPGTFLIDGFVHGEWRIERGRHTSTLLLTPFAPLQPEDRRALIEEGLRLLAFAEAGAENHEVRVVPG